MKYKKGKNIKIYTKNIKEKTEKNFIENHQIKMANRSTWKKK